MFYFACVGNDHYDDCDGDGADDTMAVIVILLFLASVVIYGGINLWCPKSV